MIPDISGETIANFIRENVDTKNATLYTDQFTGYNIIGKEMEHETLNRSEQWEAGELHTNTIEVFWSFVKRAWYGSHHHYTIQLDIRLCIWQMHAISITIGALTSLKGLSMKL